MREKKGLSSGLVQVLLFALLCTGLACRSIILRRLCFLLIFLLYAYDLLFAASKDPETDFISKLNFTALLFRSSDLLLLCDVQRDLRLKGQNKAISERPLVERLWWALRLLASPRGVGWNFEPTSHLPSTPSQPPSSSRKSRWGYVTNQAFWVAVYCPIWRIASQWSQSNPRFAKYIVLASLHRPPFPWWWRVTVWATIVDYYALMSMIHCALSAVAVGLRISDPQDWPPLFASPFEAYTVRRYWGRMWHQLYRRIFVSHSEYMAKRLHLPPGSKITTYFKLFFSFFISGLIHAAGDYGYLQKFSGGALRYFLLHACAITIEDGIIALAQKAGFRQNFGWKFVGYVWVIVWFSIALPDWIDTRLSYMRS